MSGRAPDEIWQAASDEGERRVRRSTGALLSTGFVGGFDVMLGVLVTIAATGALTEAIGAEPAHLIGSLLFGIGFVFLVVGRGELFTENFLVPVSSALARRVPVSGVARLWVATFVANYVGIAAITVILSVSGVLKPATLEAAGPIADTLTDRGWLPAFLSAVVAGAVMTLLTWLAHAAERDSARVMVALLVGVAIALPTLNHAVVSFGELLLAALNDHTDATTGEMARTLLCAVVGNVVGGLGFVTLNRLVMARGEPDTDAS
jgi:formate/nitrite transporter FocA (FNT family)